MYYTFKGKNTEVLKDMQKYAEDIWASYSYPYTVSFRTGKLTKAN